MTNQKSDFEFQSILLQSERIDKEVELRDIVSDLEIFEHLDKPYLTGKILLIDSENLLQEGDFLGGERITVAIKTLREDSKTVTKVCLPNF